MEGKRIRSCLVCRKQEKKDRLLRCVWAKGQVEWDRRQKMPGRGAYIHARAECLAALERGSSQPRVWERALRCPAGSIAPQALQRAAAAMWAALPEEPETAGRKLRGVRL